MQRFRRPSITPAAWRFGLAQWWLRPVPLVLLTIALYLSFLDFNYASLVPRSYLPSADYWFGLALLVLLACGAAVGSRLSAHGPRGYGRPFGPGYPVDVPPLLLGLLLAATVAAYAIWFGPLVFHGAAVVERFSGERSTLRTTVSTLPGVTTLTQCGVAYVILYVIKKTIGVRPPAPWERYGLALVFLLAVARSVLWSERLAVIELAVPYAVLTLAFVRFRTRLAARLTALLPLLAAVALYFAFTATEYFRSWHFYRDYYASIWQFSLDRLTAYYALATNSGIGFLQESHNWPRYTGSFVFEWAYAMPGLGDLLNDAIGNLRPEFELFLEQSSRPEFNNPTALFVIVYDIGYVGAALYFLLAGLLVGACWAGFRRHRLGGLLAYPLCLMFVLELLRFNYFAASRFIPIAFSLLLGWLWIRGHRNPAGTRMTARPLFRQEA